MIHFDMPPMKSNIIKVLGFGGGGSNAVNHMYHQHINNVDFIICNTDAQSLTTSDVPIKIQLGPHLTQGLGAGANPEVGKQATEESLEEIRRMLEINTKMAFITAGMGGGTGTGGAPTIAKVCKEMGILTVGIVTTPFAFEGPKRMKHAYEGIEELKKYVDTLLVINNDKLRQQYGNLKMKEAFSKADNVLATATRCITDIINSTGHINVDFADVCTVMKDGGVAILGSAVATGENRAIKAIEEAIHSPLLNDNDIRGAKWILLNITSAEGDFESTMDEVNEIQDYVRNLSGEETDVLLGMGYDSNLTNELGVTIIATGFGHRDTYSLPPVVKKQPKKEEPKEERIIVGVLGDAVPAAKEEVAEPADAATLMAPVLVEDAPPAQIYESVTAIDDHAAPEFLPLEAPLAQVTTASATNKPKDEIKTEPVAEELQFSLHVKPVEEPVSLDKAAATHEALVKTINGLLAKPAQVHVALPANPRAEETASEPVILQEPMVAKATETVLPKQDSTEIKMAPAASTSTNRFDADYTQPATPKKAEVSKEKKAYTEEEENFDFGLVIKTDAPATGKKPAVVVENYPAAELSEEEEQKRRAQERVDKIRKLRNLSFNFNSVDAGSEFEQVPAYLRRDTDLHNSIANVENFYSRAQVKKDDKSGAAISTINTFLDGSNPD